MANNNKFMAGLLQTAGNMIQHKANQEKERVQFQALLLQQGLKNKMEMDQKKAMFPMELEQEKQKQLIPFQIAKEYENQDNQPPINPQPTAASSTPMPSTTIPQPGEQVAPQPTTQGQGAAIPFGGDTNQFLSTRRPRMRGGKIGLDYPDDKERADFLIKKQQNMPDQFTPMDKQLLAGSMKKAYGVEDTGTPDIVGIRKLPTTATQEEITAQRDKIYSQLDPSDSALVDDVANYRTDPAQLVSRMGKNRGKYYALASLVNPSFDSTKYSERNALRKDYATGNTSKKIDNLNTAINHLTGMYVAAQGLDNTKLQTYNSVKNYLRKETGDPAVASFNSFNNALSGEMANIFKASGATDQEIASFKKNLDSSQSPAQLETVLRNYIHLMAGRAKPIESRWTSRTGSKPDFDIIYPESKQVLKQIGLDYDQMMADPYGKAPTKEPAKATGIDTEYQDYLKAINGGR